MDADADTQRPIEFGPKRSVQFVEPLWASPIALN
jgi:hypothetical protein